MKNIDTSQSLQEDGYIILDKKNLDMSRFELGEQHLEDYLNLQGFTLDGEAPLIELLLQSIDLLYENKIITREQSVTMGLKTRKLFEKHLKEIIYS